MKKFTAAMLTMALAGTMLTGCGSTASNTTTDDSAAKHNTAATDTAAEFKLATDGKLTMATNAYFEPWEYYDGENIVGIDRRLRRQSRTSSALSLRSWIWTSTPSSPLYPLARLTWAWPA